MEIQHFQLSVNLIVGIQLIILSGIGSCMHGSSFSNEAGNSISDHAALPYLEKYISGPYFEKHDSLVDSDFRHFVAHELPLESCEILQDNHDLVPQLSVLHREIIGEGSHRHLSSSITFNIQSGSILELPAHLCEAIIIERLPSGIFADPFELQRLIQRGVFMDAAVFGDTNLELPSVASNRSAVEVHLDIGPNILSRHKNRLDINVELPLHTRYPPVGSGGFSTVAFDAPDILMHCSFAGRSNNRSCLFMFASDGAASKGNGVVWKVACGNKEHTKAVSTVTFVSAAVSALLIVLAAIYRSDTKSHGKS